MKGLLTLTKIPDFFDKYHLPDGEYECTIEGIEQRFLSTEQRTKVWSLFMRLLDRLIQVGLTPSAVLVDGSFVTGRDELGDVDFAALIKPEVVDSALKAMDDHDRGAVQLLMNPDNQGAIRDLFGAHLLVVPDEQGLQYWSWFFRTGGQFGKLRDRDPERDPEWVVIPQAKGILKVLFE